MTDLEIKNRIKSGVDLYKEETYTVTDLYNHLYSIIKDHSSELPEHKRQLERLIFKTEQLLIDVNQLAAGKKSKVVAVREKSNELAGIIKYLLSSGYSVEKWKAPVKENELFK